MKSPMQLWLELQTENLSPKNSKEIIRKQHTIKRKKNVSDALVSAFSFIKLKFPIH